MDTTAEQASSAEAGGAIASETGAPEPRPTDDGGKSRVYDYSRWLDIGTGAKDCPGIQKDDDGRRKSVKCDDPDHTHIWIRLPNQFQQNECREKALAARARRIRLLRDEGDEETGRPPSDARIIMEEELDTIRRGGAEAARALIEELVNKEWFRDQLQAVENVQERDDEKFAHVERDRERKQELEREYAAGPTDVEPSAELAELRRHFQEYAKAIEEELHTVQQPKFEALADKPAEELLEMVREQRITEDAESEFFHTYSFWSWFYGTYTGETSPNGKHPQRRYPTVEALKEEDEHVIAAVQEGFQAMETVKNRREQGNS